jgi:hypothetical protein
MRNDDFLLEAGIPEYAAFAPGQRRRFPSFKEFSVKQQCFINRYDFVRGILQKRAI